MTSRLERLLKIDSAIRRLPYPTAEELCQLAEVSQRTLFKDLRELREVLNSDIRFDRIQRGYFNGSPHKKLPLSSLTSAELMMLAVVCELGCQSAGSELRSLLSQTVEKLAQSHPERLPIEMSKLSLYVQAGSKIEGVNPGKVIAALTAIEEQQQVDLLIRESICRLKLKKLIVSKTLLFEAECVSSGETLYVPFSRVTKQLAPGKTDTVALLNACINTIENSRRMLEQTELIQSRTAELLGQIAVQRSNLERLRSKGVS